MKKIITESIKKDIRTLPFDFSEKDIDILSSWGYELYMNGWNNAKKILIKNKSK